MRKLKSVPTKMKIKTEKIPYGFKDFKGGVWCDAWVDTYNSFNDILKNISPSNVSKLNFYLDQRHRLFVSYVELGGIKNEPSK